MAVVRPPVQPVSFISARGDVAVKPLRQAEHDHRALAAVADVYHALTRDRVYRPRFSHSDAIDMLERGRGTHFGPDALDALLIALASPVTT